MRKFLIIAAVFVMALNLTLSPVPARALSILDFDMAAPTAGSISYAGGATPLKGVNIRVDTVAGIGTPLNNMVLLPITGGLLNFTTGNLTGFDQYHWNFGGGGPASIVLTGGITTLGIPDNSTLLTGAVMSALVTYHADNQTFSVLDETLLDTKNDVLEKYYYGQNYPGWLGGLNLSFILNNGNPPPNAFASDLIASGDIINNQPIPEPATMLLLGFGLIGLAGYGRKKFFKK
jgi:hypothetical protein